ncbi:MAG: hypothetical protein GXY52_07495 [Chloroflexi bacterium]|nr:hypothetical protein [Chloroflexota bacterium]
MIAQIALWWLASSLLGWLAWPLCALMFRQSRLRGWAVSRIAGLLLVGWVAWLVSVLRIAPHAASLTLALTGMLAFGGILAAWRNRDDLRQVIQHEWRFILFLEVLYILVFSAASYYKAHTPDLVATEQLMDLMILRSLLRSPQMPPPDSWLAGYNINYYYGGYVLGAQLSHLTGTPAPVAYNAGIASVYSSAFIGICGLIYELLGVRDISRRLWRCLIPLAGAGAVMVASNLAGTLLALEHLQGLPVGSWLRALGGNPSAVSSPWWWWAGRPFSDINLFGRLPEVISEFPAYSLLVSDLHPHFMALPVVILTLTIAVELYCVAHTKSWWHIPLAWAAPLAVGALGWINSWDMPVFGTLMWAGYVLGRAHLLWRRRVLEAASLGAYLLAASMVSFLPFYLQLESPLGRIAAQYYVRTSTPELLLSSGIWLVPCLLVLARKVRWDRRLYLTWGAIVACGMLLSLVFGSPDRVLLGAVTSLLQGWGSGLLLTLVCALTIRLLTDPVTTERPEHRLLTLFTLAGTALLYICELVYLRDIFNTRMNTLFKLSYQAWLLLALAAIGWIAGWLSAARVRTWMRALLVVGALLACLYLPVAAFDLSRDASLPLTLDGTRAYSADERAAADWLAANALPGEYLMEAAGPDYSAANRLSALSGVPTLLGWPGHERQWRADAGIVVRRETLAQGLYQRASVEELRTQSEAYQIRYIVLGEHEIRRYGLSPERIAWFAEHLKLVFEGDELRIYRMPK